MMAATLLAGCGSKQAAGSAGSSAAAQTTAAKSDTFTYAIAGDPGSNCNPIISTGRWGLMTSNMVYSPLFKLAADGSIEWYLAKSYDLSEDKKTYTFHLRDDVKWSDGEKFTADDVLFTIQSIMNPDNASEMYSEFVTEAGSAQLAKVDDYTFSCTFPNASPAYLESFAYQLYIIPQHIFKDVKDFNTYEFPGTSVGTGPYVLTDYSAGSYLKFEANPDYFMGAPKIQNIIYRIITSQDTAMLAIQSGEVDAWATTPDYIKQMDLEGSNLTAHSYNQGNVAYMAFNCKRVPDQKVRQAVMFALDREQMNTAVFQSKDYYSDVYTFLPPNNPYYDDSTAEKYNTDAEKSKALLKEAGVTNLTLTLGYDSSDTMEETQGLLMKEQLAAVGITLNLSPMESTAYYAALKKSDNTFDMYLGGYIMGSDPNTYASLYMSNGTSNWMYYSDAAIDDLFTKGISTFDDAERKTVYTELQKAVQDYACFYPIVSRNYVVVINNRVGGLDQCKLVPIYVLGDPAYLTLS